MTATEQFAVLVPAVNDLEIRAEPDLAAAELAAEALLTALGVDLESESLRRTPARMARALSELMSPRRFDATTFPSEGYKRLVVECDIPFGSICEHHMLAFSGVAHVAYIPDERILGLSKLARLVEHFACRPQVQERLTQNVADWLQATLAPKGVGVVMSAEHSCMTLRGVRASGTKTVTSAMHGVLRDDANARNELMTFIKLTSTR